MKYEKTKHEGIFKYNNNKGTHYRVRVYYDDKTREHSKSGFKTLSEAQAYKAITESKLITEGAGILAGRTRTFGQHWESYREYKIKNNDWNKNSIECIWQ